MNYEELTNEERDALIAEKVFGWPLGVADYHTPEGMMAILEKMRILGINFSISDATEDEPAWLVEINLLDGRFLLNDDTLFFIRHKHLPTAVIIAALKALDEETGEIK